MCISLIANRYVTIKLLVEQVFLSLSGGRLQAHEVYDVFLVLRKPWKDARILAVSPHTLFRDGSPQVRGVAAPGAGGPDDVFYNDAGVYSAAFDTNTLRFSISLPSGRDEFVPEAEVFEGTVVVPRIQVPEAIRSNREVRDILEEAGTLFEIALGDLEAATEYAFRLVVDPAELQGMQERRSPDITELDEVMSNWIQDATITCSKTCLFNFLHQVSEARRVPEYAEAAATVEGLASNDSLRLMPVKRHHIVLVPPKGAELIGKTSEGCTWAVGTHTLVDGRLAAVWAAGAEQYWIDDPESMARRIYAHCKSWAGAQPKTKEEVSIAISALHANCSLLIDALQRFGGLKQVGEAKYAAEAKSDNALDGIFEEAAACREVATAFKWKGYQIRYSVQYRYISSEDRKRLIRLRWQRSIGFWAGITGVALGLISLLWSILG